MSYIFGELEFTELMYSGYHKYDFFAQRAKLIKELYPDTSISILVAGCGFGYLIEELNTLGYNNVYGIEASTYAYNRTGTSVVDKIVNGDILNSTTLTDATTLAGVDKFYLTITEDVLPCAIDQTEAKNMSNSLKTITHNIFHILTCNDSLNESRDSNLLWLKSMDWKSLLDNDPIYCNEKRKVM